MAAPKRISKTTPPRNSSGVVREAPASPVVEPPAPPLVEVSAAAPMPTMDNMLLQALEQSDQPILTPALLELNDQKSPPKPSPSKTRSRRVRSVTGWFFGWLLTLATVAGGAWYGWQEWVEPRLRYLEEEKGKASAPVVTAVASPAPVPVTIPPPPIADHKEIDALRQELQQLRKTLKGQQQDMIKVQGNLKAGEEKLTSALSNLKPSEKTPSPAPVKPVENPEFNALRQELQQMREAGKAQQQDTANLQGSLKAISEKLASIPPLAKPDEKITASLPTAVQAPLLADPQAVEKAEKLLPASELQFIKERNRLTAYADEAIALASRDAYESLWRALKNPELTRLRDGTRAEILRVRTMFFSSSRLGDYPLPLAELFPAAIPKNEADLTSQQLGGLLLDGAKDWQIRAKSARLLGRRPSMEACDALAKALESDTNLEVLKECQFALEENTGFRAEILDYAAGPAWWKDHREEFLKRAQPKPATPASSPPP